MKVINVFYNVHMGISFAGMGAMLPRLLRGDECAVFVNRQKTGCKVLLPDGLSLYYRPAAGTLTPEAIAAIPSRLKGRSLSFSAAAWSGILKEFKTVSAEAA